MATPATFSRQAGLNSIMRNLNEWLATKNPADWQGFHSLNKNLCVWFQGGELVFRTYRMRTEAPLEVSFVTSDGLPLTDIEDPLEASTSTC